MRNPFSLYKKLTKQGPVWYARFWDEKAGRYALKRSTGVVAEGKRERRGEAERKAWEMLSEIRLEQKAPTGSWPSIWPTFGSPIRLTPGNAPSSGKGPFPPTTCGRTP